MGVFKRNGNYWIDYYDAEGRRHRKKIGPQKGVAHIALKDVKVKIARGEYLGIYEEKKTFFKDFSEKYLKLVQPNLSPTSYTRFVGIINNHLERAFLFADTAKDPARHRGRVMVDLTCLKSL